MKSIKIRLSEESILRAIHKLNTISENIRWGANDLVECLAEDGAKIANASYGSMEAYANAYSPEEGTAIIAVAGSENLIAEFGAGDSTDPATGFENKPDTPVYAGSYSESEEGSGEYAATGQWHFGGRTYTEVPPRKGLLNAKAFIIATAKNTAEEVIKL